MPDDITVATLAERVKNYHDDTKADLCEIKVAIIEIKTNNMKYESRIGHLEGRQGMLVRLVFYALGSGGIAGAAVALLAKLGIGTGD